MAALTLAAGVALVVFVRPDSSRAADGGIVNKVTLSLRITGLGSDGCEIEVKPGHAACQFKPVTRKVDKFGQVELKWPDVKSTSPDRDCLFSITVKEPGQPPRTVRRGLRLSVPAADKPVPEQTFMCLLRSPSLAAKDDTARRLK